MSAERPTGKSSQPIACICRIAEKHVTGLTVEKLCLILEACGKLVGDEVMKKYKLDTRGNENMVVADPAGVSFFWNIPIGTDPNELSAALTKEWTGLMTELDSIGVESLLKATGYEKRLEPPPGYDPGKSRPPPGGKELVEVRTKLLNGKPVDYDIGTLIGKNKVWAVIVDKGYLAGTSCLIALANGNARLHFTSSASRSESQDPSALREAAMNLNQVADGLIGQAAKATAFPFPKGGTVFFYILAADGVYTIQTKESDIKQKRHPLHPLFLASHEVTTKFKLAAPVAKKS